MERAKRASKMPEALTSTQYGDAFEREGGGGANVGDVVVLGSIMNLEELAFDML